MKTNEQHWCPRYVTTSFIAEHCGVSKVTVLGWIEEKRLLAFRLPKGHYRIYRNDFLSFMDKNNIPLHPRKIES